MNCYSDVMGSLPSPRASRPGGRSAAVAHAVYTAVGQLVGEGHRLDMTVPQIAERAGVNPTSVYRRWGSVEALLEHVAVAALTRDEPLPDTGDIAEDLRVWGRAIADDVFRPERMAYLRAMTSARQGLVESCPCTDHRITQARALVRRAEERGQAAPTPQQIMDHLISPLYYRAVFGLAVDGGYVARLVDDVLALAVVPVTRR